MNSRLIGEIVEARVFADHLEIWYGGQKMEQLPRLRGRAQYRRNGAHRSLTRPLFRGKIKLAPDDVLLCGYNALVRFKPGQGSDYRKAQLLSVAEGS